MTTHECTYDRSLLPLKMGDDEGAPLLADADKLSRDPPRMGEAEASTFMDRWRKSGGVGPGKASWGGVVAGDKPRRRGVSEQAGGQGGALLAYEIPEDW